MAKNLVLSAANRERVRELLDHHSLLKQALARVNRGRSKDVITCSIADERGGDFIDVSLMPSVARSAIAAELEATNRELGKFAISVR